MEKVLELYKYIDGVNDVPFPSNEEQLVIGDFKYDAKRMGGAPIITFNAMHRLCLDKLWDKNVYATFNGERYFIKQTPTSSYSNTDTRYKHDVELVSERVVLDNIYFYDVVTNNHDVDKPVSNSSKFTFFGDVDEYVSRLNYSLSWSGVNYNVVIDDGVTSEEKQVTFENQIITNALQEIYNIYKIPYYFVGKTIHIGEYQDNIDHVFKYGADNSLLSISKNNSNAKIVNRITGVGSSDNIPYYYPNDDEKGVTRPLLNGSSNGVSVDNQSRYRKVRLSDKFVFHSTIQTQTPLIDSSIYTLGDLIFDKKEEGKDAQYSVDFYYTFSLDDGENVLFEVSSNDESTVSLRYEIYKYKTNGNHLGYFSGNNTVSLTGGTYNFIVRWTFLHPEVMFGVEEQLESLISSKLNIAAYIVVDENNSWTLKNIPVNLYSYGLKVNNPSDGDVISIEQVSYINTQPNLMPFIYRNSEGNERFYNAINNTYKDGDGNYYIFDNEYSKNHPSEYIENFDDIKPTIKNVTNAKGSRIDKFVDFAYDLYDNDEVDENNKYIHKYFFAKLNKLDGDLGFNLFDHSIDEGEMIISMTSGSCGSCSFKIMVDKDTQKNTVQVDEYGNLLRDNNGNVRFGTPQDRQNDTENNEVWIALEKDATTFGVLMPNASNRYRPIAGDTFVILHIDLPKDYIVAAEKRLESKLIDFMHDNNFEKFNFSIVFSRIFFAENPSVLNNLNENAKIQVEYDGNEYSLFASSISISITSESPIPEIKVELSDNISISQNQISQIVESTKKEILSKTTKDVFWGDIKGIPSWIGSEKPKYSYSELSGKGISDDSNGLWVLKKDSKGNSYIYTNLYVVTQQGVTMYSDTSNLDLPSIYDGLHIDNDTIYWEEIKDEEGNVISKRLKARGGSGEGGITPTLLGDLTNVGSWANSVAIEDRIMVQRKGSSSWVSLNLSEIGGGYADFSNVTFSGNGNAFTSFTLSEDKKTLTFVKGRTFALQTELDKKWTTDNEKIENWNTAFNWGDHSKVGYAKTGDVTDELKKYVTLGGKETITGEKDFTGGLKVNGSPIVYDKTNKYWKLEGDLLVTGGITMYGVDGSSFGTIWDNAPLATSNKNYKGVASFDPNYFSVSNGYVTFIGQTGGGVADSVAWSDVTGKPTWIGNSKPSYTTNEVTEGTNLYFTNARAVNALANTLSSYVNTTLTDQTITKKKTFAEGCWVLAANESGVISNIHMHNSTWGNVSSPTLYGIRNGIGFAWQNTKWVIGNIRGNATDSYGFGIGYHDGSKLSPSFRVTTGGSIYVNGGVYPNSNDASAVGSSAYQWSNIYAKKVTVDGIEMKKSSSGVLFLDANLVVSGGVTMYGTDGTTSTTIWDNAPIANTQGKKGVASYDPNFFAVNNGVVTFVGQIGGGIESITKQMVIDALGYTPYNSTNPNGYITGITKSDVTTALGYTPYNSTNPNGYITSSGSITGNAATATNATNASNVYTNTSSTDFVFPVVFTSNYSKGNQTLFVDSASGAGYNPSTNTFVGNGFSGNSVTLGNGVSTSIKTKGWYRFATTINAENVAGGSLIFSIRRQYNNYKTESHIIAVSVGYSTVTFTQIAGAPSDVLITKVRATNTKDGVIYFDFYYGVDTTSAHNVYVNCIGSASLQTPTSTTQLLSYVTEFDLANGFKSNVLHFTSLNNLGYLRSKCGKNLLVGGDNLSGGTAYAFAGYSYDSAVKVNRTYRLTICGKLGENTSHIYAYWDGGSGNNTYIGGLSKTEERIITVRAKITNKGSGNRLVFYKFNSSNTQETTSYSYIRWAYLEEEFQEGELSTTTDYNTWLTEYNKRDTKSFLHKIQRIDVGDSYWSADKGIVMKGSLTLNDTIYSPNSVTAMKIANNSGTYIGVMSMDAANNFCLGYDSSASSYDTYIDGFNMHFRTGNTHSEIFTLGSAGGAKLYLKTSALVIKRNHSSGGAYTQYQPCNQENQSWAAGVNNSYQYSWWYQNVSSGIDAQKMYLDSSGNLLTTGGITMYSDIRKKTILNHVELSLKEVADAPLIEHYYNSDEAKTTHVGSVAQYWAGLNDWFCKEDSEGFLTMEIQNAALASAISVARELTRYESKTDKQIKKLKKRIGELEEEIENLKNK